MRHGAAALAGTALLALAPATPALARSETTIKQTIADRDGDNRLDPAAGDDLLVRENLGQALPGRDRRRRQLLVFGQFSDTHVVDEESPARVEFLDKFGPPFTSAYRPQEAMSAQVVNEMVEQMRNTTSPVSGRQVQLVIATGDNSDNTQLNETRWYIDLLDGGVEVDPDSGVQGTCGDAPGTLYDGVRNGNEYYEPDSSTTPGANEVDGPGYSPDQSENEREAQRSSSVRDFPGLFEDANRPFQATGLGLPWYSVFGNHDALLQGNQPRNDAFERVATGCVKVRQLSPAALAQIQALGADGFSAEDGDRAYAIALAELARAQESPGSYDGAVASVPLDERRRPLKKSEYIAEHFKTHGTPVGHGFTADNLASGQGNYSFKPRPGLRFVVLDTIAENGGDGGNVDHPQFEWLHSQLSDAERRRELVMVFAHHSLATMNQPPASVFPPGDQGGNAIPLVHYGLGGDDQQSPCTTQDPAAPVTPDETLHCLFLRHRSVIAFVNGHEHNNRISPFERRDAAGRVDGGFWEINTASHIDWPQQSRLIDVFDNRDGNLSIFGVMLDHAGAPNPGGPPPSDGQGTSPEGVSRLASISRELSFNDPDSSNGEDGRGDARGGDDDRNVELLVRNPYGSPAG